MFCNVYPTSLNIELVFAMRSLSILNLSFYKYKCLFTSLNGCKQKPYLYRILSRTLIRLLSENITCVFKFPFNVPVWNNRSYFVIILSWRAASLKWPDFVSNSCGQLIFKSDMGVCGFYFSIKLNFQPIINYVPWIVEMY